MNILILCSGNAPDFDFRIHQAFIYDQTEAVKKADSSIQFDLFFIKGKGIQGYLKSLKKLRETLQKKDYFSVHAHFCYSALLANLQRSVPVIATYHGSDINMPKNRIISAITALLSKANIYVSQTLQEKAVLKFNKKDIVIPCGVDLELFSPIDKSEARKKLALPLDTPLVLFSSGFNVPVKNYPLAKKAMEHLDMKDVRLLELKGFSRKQVAWLFSAADAALMTSFSEGSPQFIKEAMACNCPIVSTPVGDVADIITSTDGCYITPYNAVDVAANLRLAIEFGRTNGRKKISHLDNRQIAEKIVGVYFSV